ncbi:MAG TPA: cytochrome c oxidase subunit II [Actinomycetales bacterium]|nr:cytochrome c oxidase subunit II [Actinomycetales bacterium]
MRPDDRARTRRRGFRLAAVSLAALLVTAGCSTEQLKTGFLPSTPDTTNHTGRVITLWNGSWIAALFVGAVVWGLIIWCVAAYRRRKDETGLPAQVRYNVPLEILYTVVPIFMVAVLFYFTARDQSEIEARNPNPDVSVQVIGKQWAWDFNYKDANVYETSQQVPLDGTRGPEAQIPVLYLPVDKSVEIQLNARDVIHSFWVPAFLYKKDIIPGRTNYMTFTPTKEGVYKGKCAELCGEYHSEMLFDVAVVSQAEFDKQMQNLRQKGQVGQLSMDLSRQGQPSTDLGITEDQTGESGGSK